MVKVLIFDLDGTLVDTHEAHTKAFRKAFIDRGLTIKKSELKKQFGKVAEDIIKSLFPKLGEGEITKLISDKREYFTDYVNLVKALPCAEHVLEKAEVAALATSSSPDAINALLDRFNWRDYFKAVVNGYQVPAPKPAPDILLRVTELLGVKVSDCLFIGDSIHDARSAKSAGMGFTGILTGAATREEFKKEGFKSYQNLCYWARDFF